MSTRRTLLAALGALAIAAPSLAQAQDFPSRPLKLVVPFGPGTTTDIISRVYADALSKPLGQTVVVENKPGAGGNIGADSVAKATPDGYTVLFGIDTTTTVNPHIYKSMAAMGRATMSVGPPAGKGTTMRIGCEGKDCANEGPAKAATVAPAAAASTRRRSESK